MIKTQTLGLLESVGTEWMDFQQAIIDSEQQLKKHKEKFKLGLLTQGDEFRKKVTQLTNDFVNNGPFTSVWNVTDAIDKLQDFK